MRWKVAESIPITTQAFGHQKRERNEFGALPLWTFKRLHKIFGYRKGLFSLDSISIDGNLIYWFGMLHIEFTPLSKQIGTVRRKVAAAK